MLHYIILAGLELDMYHSGLDLTENPLPLPLTSGFKSFFFPSGVSMEYNVMDTWMYNDPIW